MSTKKISIKVNNSKETIEQYSVTGGENGAGKLKQPLHINAQKDVNYLLVDEETQFAPENIAVKRVDKNLVIAFEGGDVENPDLIIENYFADNGAIGYQDGSSNLIIGQYENGQYFPYVPESAVKADAISQLADGQAAGQAIGGDALPPIWAFNPWWLAALVPLIGIPAVAISGGGGGGGHSKVVDHAPIAGDDSAHAKHNTPVAIHVTANDSDVDGDLNPNSIRIVKEGSKGTVAIGKDGKIIYTPNKGEYGVDTVTYVVKDKAGHESNVATITINIDAAPEAKDDTAATKESKPVTIDMENNYSDKDGDVDHSSLEIRTNGGKGFAKFVNGKLVYQPNKGEVGTDTITYTVTDKNGNVSEDATITINIDAPPVANDDSAKANKATPVELDVLGNDTDLDGDIDPTTLEVVTVPTKGTVKVVDGKLVYTANPDATGQDTITYLVKDKNGNVSNKATVTIDITEPPVANKDEAETRHSTPVEIDITANDTDRDGDLDKSSVVITHPGTKGTVTIGENGKLTYTPNPGEHGTDTITYQIKDKAGNISNEATITVKIDAAPVATNDKTDTRHNIPVEIDITANDTDTDGDLDKNSVLITQPGSKGTVTIGEDGKLTYTPNKGEHGTDTITYQIKDKNGNVSNTATVTVVIDAPPVANKDSAAIKEGETVTLDVLANDTDLDGKDDIDPSTLTIITNGGKGTAEFVNGKLVYTAKPGEVGTDTITYTVKDKNGNVSNEATVTIVIDAAPVANKDSAAIKEGETVTLDVLANDTDLDGKDDIDPSTLTIITNGGKGTAEFFNGKLVYTAKPGEVGTDTITYTVKDKHGNVSNETTVTIVIDAAPVANKDSAAIKEGETVTLDVLANDTDLDGKDDIDPSTLTIITNGGKGTAEFFNGKLVYTAKPGEVGTDTITYTVKDKNGNVSNETTVTIVIDAAPVANKDSAAIKEGETVTLDVLANDTDLDGKDDIDPSTLTIITNGGKGTAEFVNGKLVYTAKPGEVGTDTITYTVKDKHGNVSNETTVTIVIDAAPVANKDSAAIKEGETVTLDVLANDTDLDGKDDIDPSTLTIITNGGKGTAEFVNGKLVYTAKPGEVGTDTITYTVKDKNGNVSNETTVTIVIDAAPVANKDSAAIKEGETVTLDVLANDTDLDGKDDIDPSTLTIITNGGKGTAEFVNGKLVYTAKPGEVGTDTITYTVKDKNGNVSNETTVTIVIDAAPVANKDSAAIKEGETVTLDVLANDTDLDGKDDIDPSTLTIITNGGKGTAEFVNGKLVYTAKPGEVGTDTITYTVKDKHGNISNEATVTIEIDAAPVANKDSAAIKEGETVTLDVLANDTDLDGKDDIDPSTLTIITNGGKGTAEFVNGKLVYTAKPGEVGTDTITYTVKDKNGNVSNEATVTIVIDAAPVANKDSAAIKEGETVTLDVLANDTDLDGKDDIDPSTLTIITNGGKGTAEFVNGKLVYTAKPGEVGTDTITYTVKDKHGNVSNETTVTIVIDAAPVANKDSAAIKEGETVTLDVLANDTDLDGKDDIDPSTLTIITNGGKGTAEFFNGKLVYTAKPGEVGTDTITYTVKDKNGNVSNETTVTIVIDAAPVANKDSAAIKEGETVTLDVLANDTDLDGKDDIDPSTLTIITNGGKGTAEFVNGKLVYTAKPGEVGTDTITYTVKDKNGNVSNETTVTIVIDAAPIANKDSAKANKAIPVEIDVLKNDTDLDGDIDPTTLEVVGEPTKGTVKVVDGQLVYTANPDATGQDIITYLVKDKNGNVSNTATVTIAINEPPVAGDDHGQTKQGVPTVIDVLNNDKDPDGELDKSTLHIEKNGSKGTATFDADGKLIYTPKPGAIGQDTITYTVKDNDGKVSNIATVTIDIAPTQTTPTEVFEKGLRTDGTAGSSAIVADGVVILANPDDKPVAEQDIQITKPTTELTSGGKPITWESTDNGFVGKDAGGNEVITLTTNSSTENGQTKVGYEVTLKGLVDHPVGKESLKVEFGVKNGNDEVKTEIVVHDDKPEAANVGLSVEPPAENTFYANVVISLDFSGSMWERDSGLPDVIDPVDQYGRPQQMFRYDAALNAIDTLLDSYQERLDSATKGDVRVSLNGFADKAVAIGGSLAYSDGNAYWCTLDEAKEIVEALRVERWHPPFKKDVDKGGIGGSTNYDASLQQILSIYKNKPNAGEPVKEPTVDNTFFFISDGAPSVNNDGSSNGIEAKSRPDFEAGNAGHDIGEDKWTEFLAENGIRSVAIGIGQDMVPVEGRLSGEDHLKPIAFDGQKGANNDANDVIVLKDMSSLGNILSKYVPNENTIESNFAEGSDGKTTLSFGADGKSSISIDVDGVTYTYDANKGTITSNGTDKSKWADFGEGEVAIKTDAGGLLSISLGDKNFGHLTYRPGATRPTGMTEEKFTLTLTDKDGTSSKPTITVDISKLKESGNTGLNDTDLTALKLFSPESAMELHGVDTDVNATSSHSTGFMNSSLDALQETQHAMI